MLLLCLRHVRHHVDRLECRVISQIVLHEDLIRVHHDARKRVEADANGAVSEEVTDVVVVEAELDDIVVGNGEIFFRI